MALVGPNTSTTRAPLSSSLLHRVLLPRPIWESSTTNSIPPMYETRLFLRWPNFNFTLEMLAMSNRTPTLLSYFREHASIWSCLLECSSYHASPSTIFLRLSFATHTFVVLLLVLTNPRRRARGNLRRFTALLLHRPPTFPRQSFISTSTPLTLASSGSPFPRHPKSAPLVKQSLPRTGLILSTSLRILPTFRHA